MSFSTTRSLLAAVLLAAVPLTGCQQTTHEENVDAANNRWMTMRSALMLDMAQQQFDTGDLDQAERTVSDALQVDPERASLHVLAGRIAIERGRLERAYHLFTQAIELEERHADAHYYRGLVFQRWQQYDDAQQDYQRAYEIQPDEVAYLLAAAEMMVELDRVEDGIAMLEDRLSYFDQSASLRAALGYFHRANGRPDRAADYFERAAMLDPENSKLQEELGKAYIAAGDNEKGIKILLDLIDERDGSARRDLRQILAQAYLEIDRRREAREQYLRMARSDRAQPDDWMRLAEMAWEQGELQDAMYAVNQALEMSPRHLDAHLLGGMIWQQRGELDEALRMYDRAAEIAPDDAAPVILRGVALQRAGRLAAAAEAYQQALQRQPDHPRAQQLLHQIQ